MKKSNLSHFIKIALTMLAFILGYAFAMVYGAAVLAGWSFVNYLSELVIFFVVGVVVIIVYLIIFKLYALTFSSASVMEGVKGLILNIVLFVINVIIRYSFMTKIPLRWCMVVAPLFLIITFFILYIYRFVATLKNHAYKLAHKGKRVLIIGAGEAGMTILREIKNSDKTNLNAVGFLDDDKEKIGNYIYGIKVLGNTSQIDEIVKAYDIEHIIIAMPTVKQQKLKEITDTCVATKKKIQILPGIYQMLNGQVLVSKLKNVDVQDLLGREPVTVNLDEVMGYIENQVVLVTGGGGSIGSELCRQVASHNPKKLIILDIYENNAYEIEQELKRSHPEVDLLVLIASVRDSVKMDDVFNKYRPDIVFHAAAHKHVPLMETSPNEAVKNNIIGTYKVVKCADKYGVKRFVQISTDKAVNPTNIMGATKRVCEMIIQAFSRKSKTKFVAVRFGNVLGSNGSVIPLFKKQIAEGGPVTVTHKDIIRYFMTIPEAVSLVLQAGAYAKGGEIFVLDMGEQVRIYDLAEKLIKLSGLEPNVDIDIICTGLRPGEKLYEERLMAEEGLQKTANNRISIGKPIEIDDEKLFEVLDELYEEAYNETDKMKELVQVLVPTYVINKQ